MNKEQKENQEKSTSKNPFLYLAKKIIADPVPFLFFGSLIGLKIYHFINKIDFVSEFMGIMYGIDQSLTGLKAILFSRPVLDLMYTTVAILFDGIIIFSYIIRLKPSKDHGKAQGFRERWFPIITVLLPMIVFTYLIFRPFPLQHDPLFHSLYQSQSFVHSVIMAGLALSLIGCVLSIVALWKLRNSFSLMVEVRQLVTTGMYKYMRHPLYFSELIHALGTTLLLLNSISLPAYVIFFTLEIIRAKFEERKFLKLLPEYADYKAKTGFFYPRFKATTKTTQRAAQGSFQSP